MRKRARAAASRLYVVSSAASRCARVSERNAQRDVAQLGLRRHTGGVESAGSNPAVPTIRTIRKNVSTQRYGAGMHKRRPQKRTWSDEQLPAAVAAATSRRGVMRELGLSPSNGGTTQTIRRRSALLGLDTSHFRGNRSWSDTPLRKAVNEGRTGTRYLRRSA